MHAMATPFVSALEHQMTNLPNLLRASALAIAVLAISRTAGLAADYAPLECKEASSQAHRRICSSYSLGQAEARMATLFGMLTALAGMGQRDEIKDSQREWLSARDSCGDDVGCLADAYAKRISELNRAFEAIASRAPL